MNALEQIERQLSESVAARAHDDTARLLGAPPTARRAWAATARRWLGLRPAQLALAGALAAVLLVVGLSTLGSTPGPTPAAAAALQQLARIAAHGPSLVPGPGQYLAVRSVSDYQSFYGDRGCVSSEVEHSRAWIAADGAALVRGSDGPPAFTSPADRALCQTSDPSPLKTVGRSGNEWFAPNCYGLAPTTDMRSLSTDPRTLLRQMRAIERDPHTPADDFAHVGDFLRETDAGPPLRAALYRAAELIPGVELLGTVRDHLGRRGLGVALTTRGVRDELIFNPRTAALMGERSTGSLPGSDSWAVYFRSRVVDRLPVRPPVSLSPACHPTHLSISHHVPGGTLNTGR